MSIDWTAEAISAAATVVLTILTAVLAFGSIVLWRSTRRLVKSAEDTAERELRAYVWIKATELHDLQAGAFPRVMIEVRNAGQTPAYEMLISAGCLAFNYPFPANTPFPTIRPRRATRMVLHPGVEPPFQAVADTRDTMNSPHGLSPQQVQALIQGDQMRLFVFALVTYRDAFAKNRETYFCVSVDATAAVTAGASPYQVNFEHCDQHNSAT